MIVCEHHETAHCLELQPEESYVKVGDNGHVGEIFELYKCRGEGLVGTYRWMRTGEYGVETLQGSITATDEQPRTAEFYRKRQKSEGGR